jgi:hypothetical protein
MDNDEFYKILGRITYSYTRIDFLISTIASDLGVAESPYDFFARTRFDKKIESLKSSSGQITDEKLKSEFVDWLDYLEELRKQRNTVTHSIILQNTQDDSEYRLFNYKKNGARIEREIYVYKNDDLRNVDNELIKAHNVGHELWTKLKVGKGK